MEQEQIYLGETLFMTDKQSQELTCSNSDADNTMKG